MLAQAILYARSRRITPANVRQVLRCAATGVSKSGNCEPSRRVIKCRPLVTVGRKGFNMRRLCIALVIATTTLVVAAPGRALAQDQNNNPEDINRKYQDALAQLKSAQDRKNELAAENEKLHARIADLEKQLDEQKRTA